MAKFGTAQRRDFEGKVNERGPMGGSKLVGSGMNANQIGGQERDAGKKYSKGEAYKNECDEPKFQMIDHKQIGPEQDLGMMKDCSDFKREASGQAFGQAGMQGSAMDDKKIRAQFRPVYSDDTGY